jgi:hypothetical protein
MLRLTLPCAQVAQAELRTCSGRAQDVLRHAQECSPSAQVKAAAAHVQTLKQNQRKKKLSMTLMVLRLLRPFSHHAQEILTLGSG